MNKGESVALFGKDLFGDPIEQETDSKLYKEYVYPPFSVLDARSGYWQDRKRAWLSLGIRGEEGRNIELTYQGQASKFDYYRVKEGTRENTDEQSTSIFDPVLTELIYKWFCPPGGQIIDPFAGGSVRGIVAGYLGYKYWGCDLSSKQIDANYQQASEIVPRTPPAWVRGDTLDCVPNSPECDLIFSCPPYGDLERYSDDPRDLSTMEYHTFIAQLKRIIHRCCLKLKNNRFASFCVGDFRDSRGFYRNFVSDTISGFKEQGLELYNEAILITQIGSLPIRIRKAFDSSRKMGKTHQNILVFVKGDPKKATEKIKG